MVLTALMPARVALPAWQCKSTINLIAMSVFVSRKRHCNLSCLLILPVFELSLTSHAIYQRTSISFYSYSSVASTSSSTIRF